MHSGRNSESEKKTVRSLLTGMGKQQWAVLLLTGILLAVIAFPTSGGNSKAALSENVFEETEGSGTGTDLELRLQNLLENVEGVGRVKVLITYSETSQTVPMYNEETSQKDTEEKDTNRWNKKSA